MNATETATQTGFAVRRGTDGRDASLAMQQLLLTGSLTPAGGRLAVRHVFRSAEPKPLELVYAFILPRDAQLRRFTIAGEGFSVESDLEPVKQARETYEKAIEKGHLAAIARNYADGYVNLAVGNVRPGETVTVHLEILAGVEQLDDGFRFRYPFTVAPVYHARAHYTETAPGQGEVELPADVFGDLLLPPVRAQADGLHAVGFDLQIVPPGAGASIKSPSHALQVAQPAPDRWSVALGRESDLPNRDLVLEVRTGAPAPWLLTGSGANGTRQIAAVIPSTAFPAAAPNASGDVVFLLDHSGSMNGACLTQAKRAVRACLSTLTEKDRFALVVFDDAPASMSKTLLPATAGNRRMAEGFLEAVHADGGTELGAALQAAAGFCTGEAHPDIFLVTDGEVGETDAIVKLATGLKTHVHVLGIGSASQDRFLTRLARESGGISRYLTPDERVDMEGMALFADSRSVRARGLQASLTSDPAAKIVPALPPAVFDGKPVLLFAEIAEAVASSALRMSWDRPTPGQVEFALPAATADGCGETLRLLRGARLITDFESANPAPETTSILARRKAGRTEKALENLSAEYGLASRCMALVAVVKRAGDRPGQVPETQVIPVGMPAGKEFSSYFGGAQGVQYACASPPQASGLMFSGLRARRSVRFRPANMVCEDMPARDADLAEPVERYQAAPPSPRMQRRQDPQPATQPMEEASRDFLLEQITRIEADGGLPGTDAEERAAQSLLLLFCLAIAEKADPRGAFRLHRARLAEFLELMLADGALLAPAKDAVQQALRILQGDCGLDTSETRWLDRFASTPPPRPKDVWTWVKRLCTA